VWQNGNVAGRTTMPIDNGVSSFARRSDAVNECIVHRGLELQRRCQSRETGWHPIC
jgi:hypothetical protein